MVSRPRNGSRANSHTMAWITPRVVFLGRPTTQAGRASLFKVDPLRYRSVGTRTDTTSLTG